MKIPIENSIDLHTFAPRDVVSVVEEYVTAAHEAGLREVRLIHGVAKVFSVGLSSRRSSVIRWWLNSGMPRSLTWVRRSRGSRRKSQ